MTEAINGATPLLRVEQLVKHYPARGRGRRNEVVHALCGVSLSLAPGETFAVVGESGSGKTTLLRTVLGLERPTAGKVWFNGTEVTGVTGASGRAFRRNVSVVFQDPYTSLDPRMTVTELLREPGRIQGQLVSQSTVRQLLDQVRLPADSGDRFPHEFSGGQRQRIAIARALAVDPKMIVLDEPVSALDVSVQAEIIDLLRELQAERGVSYLFVAHDLAVVAELSHRIGVMYGGQMVEQGQASAVIRHPSHPYTQALLAAVPVPQPELQRARLLAPLPVWPTDDDPAKPCPHLAATA